MRTMLCLSGGMDSSTLLSELLWSGDQVATISFDYGQRHRRELDAAKVIAHGFGVDNQVIALPGILSGSALTGQSDIPHGHYEADSMRATVVAGRNMIMIAIAASVAIQKGFDRVAYSAHAGDHHIYPDCRPAFVVAMDAVMQVADEHPISLYAPFLQMTKREIALRAMTLGVPLDHTWTCYEGGADPCGKCGACVERNEAIAWAELYHKRGARS